MPACVIVNILPPTEIVPLRGAAPGLASTAYVTRRLPVPAPPAGSVTRIQPTVLVATHVQVDGAATSKVPLPPATAEESPLRERSTVQLVNPVCVTVCVTLPAVRPAVRDAASGLAAAR